MRDCPACGQLDWSVAEWPVLMNAVDLDTNAILTPSGEMKGMGFFIVGCNNCGFARLHRVTTVLDLQN